jgi:arginyl-tRNA synthetase
MSIIEQNINIEITNAFNEIGYYDELLGIKTSQHADYQCNDSLAVAKKIKKNPREIAKIISEKIVRSHMIESAEVAGPGFINITVTNEFLTQTVKQIRQHQKYGFEKEDEKKKVFLDYGGPNIAKILHVGHLRSAVIGESLKRIEIFCGNETQCDIHLGDWGTPMGKCIYELSIEEPTLPYFDSNKVDNFPDKSPVDVVKLGQLYVNGNKRCQEDENAAKQARLITSELQKGNPGYMALWRHFRNISIQDIKGLMNDLDVYLDLWNGESNAQEILDNDLMQKIMPSTEMSDGARIISLNEFEKTKKIPPAIIVKSDGGYTYHSSDIADIYRRTTFYNADEIIYCIDNRQSLHFEQIVLASIKANIINEDYPILHAGFGTVNGKDGKPYKTRDGGIASLRSLIDAAFNKAIEMFPEPSNTEEEKEIRKLAKQVSVAALKFNDLKNPRMSDYTFDMDTAMSFEGKTGPYMQYAVARINSIFEKAGVTEDELENTDSCIKDNHEREIAIHLDGFSKAVKQAYIKKDAVYIADYAYELAKAFSSFYTECSIYNTAKKGTPNC